LPCSLESNLPCIFNNREEVLPFAKTSLNQIRGFAKVFKPKFKGKQIKEKEKEFEKAKGPWGTILAQPEREPTAQQGSLPKR
jgi:hypothetical protein